MNSVCKWGGSSISSGTRALRVANFIKQNNIPIVVLSAPGKSTPLEDKITDLLIKITTNIQDIDIYLKQINDRYTDIIKTLNINFDIVAEINKIKNKYLQSKDNSYLISRGEYLMAKIFAKHLNYKFIDSKDIIKFDKNGKLLESTYNLIKNAISKYKQVVIPGFYGSHKNNIKIFSRGGSDITGAIVARALNKNYFNFTDIDGVYNKYPLTDTAKKLKSLSYEDMKFLGLFGFSVLHHKCCDILKDTNLKVFIKSSFEPQKRPTTIKPYAPSIFASSEKEFNLTQSKDDIYDWFLERKIFVFFKYQYLDNYFYLIDTKSLTPTKTNTFKVFVKAIISNKFIDSALLVEPNHYLKIKKVATL